MVARSGPEIVLSEETFTADPVDRMDVLVKHLPGMILVNLAAAAQTRLGDDAIPSRRGSDGQFIDRREDASTSSQRSNHISVQTNSVTMRI